MLPRSVERRVGIYRNFGFAIFVLGLLGWLAFQRNHPIEAGLWYGAVLVLSGTLFGYVAGFERGREYEEQF